ncbi:hypothetical protein HDG37_000637 [Paraburkholderia sp. MM5384-R2]|nr:hypothetical protein [Paraburkholderia sp. MM5384-R2]
MHSGWFGRHDEAVVFVKLLSPLSHVGLHRQVCGTAERGSVPVFVAPFDSPRFRARYGIGLVGERIDIT